MDTKIIIYAKIPSHQEIIYFVYVYKVVISVCLFVWSIITHEPLNPIPVGVLENKYTLGGGASIRSPLLNSMFDVQI